MTKALTLEAKMNQTKQTEKNGTVIAMMRVAVAVISNKVTKHLRKTPLL
jgi:hypothetical protein